MLAVLTTLGLIDTFTLGVALFTPLNLGRFVFATVIIKLIIEIALIWRDVDSLR